MFKDFNQLGDMGEEITQLIGAAEAVATYGINPSAVAVLQTTRLLSGTSLEAIAIEAFQDAPAVGDETDMALESLTDKIKEKATEWSTKILHVLKTSTEKVLSTLGKIWTKISASVKTLTGKAWDAAKAAKAHFKDHPYQLVAAAVGGAVAAVGVIAFIASQVNGPYANESALQTFMYKVKDMVDKIKTPAGDITTTVTVTKDRSDEILKHSPDLAKGASSFSYKEKTTIHCTIDKSTKGSDAFSKSTERTTDINGSGWTQTGVKSISAQLSKIWDTLKHSLYTIGLNAAHVMDKGVNAANSGLDSTFSVIYKAERKIHEKTGSEFLSKIPIFTFLIGVRIAMIGIISLIIKLITWVISTAFRLVSAAFNGLVGVFA